MKGRVEIDLRSVRPFKSAIDVNVVDNPAHSSWIGARSWWTEDDRTSAVITKSDYEERGGEYLKEHTLSNKYYPTPQ